MRVRSRPAEYSESRDRGRIEECANQVNEQNSPSAVALLATRQNSGTKCSPLLRSWLAAAHGEALAADDEQAASLHVFDTAADMLPSDSSDQDGPYVALNHVHLARWRGHALARFGAPEAVDVLTTVLEELDSSFTRAETSLRVDLATALAASGKPDACAAERRRAIHLAIDIGSMRQQRRLRPSS